jgi:hypothetical protein
VQLSLELKRLEEGGGATVVEEQIRSEMLRTMLAYGRDSDHVSADSDTCRPVGSSLLRFANQKLAGTAPPGLDHVVPTHVLHNRQLSLIDKPQAHLMM